MYFHPFGNQGQIAIGLWWYCFLNGYTRLFHPQPILPQISAPPASPKGRRQNAPDANAQHNISSASVTRDLRSGPIIAEPDAFGYVRSTSLTRHKQRESGHRFRRLTSITGRNRSRPNCRKDLGVPGGVPVSGLNCSARDFTAVEAVTFLANPPTTPQPASSGALWLIALN